MNNIYTMKLYLPAGVGVQQTRDGMLILTYTAELVSPLREKLDQLRADLLEKAIQAAEENQAAELKRQQLPKDKLEILADELAALKAQRASDVPLGVGKDGHQPPRLEPRS